jgi:Phage major capsid protein E
MPILNPFAADAFSAGELSAAINIVPNRYGRLNELNLMPVRGSSSDTIIVEEKNGILTLLPSVTPGGPSTVATRAKRKKRSFIIPHIPHDDHVSPRDIQNLLAFGSNTQKETMLAFVNERLMEMKAKHDQTLEWLRVGALKGNIIDGDGSTVLYNLFTEFGITQKSIDFLLGTSTTNILKKCLELKRHIEKNLKGETMREVRVLVHPDFYDAFVGHAKVEAAYAGWQAAQERLGGDMRNGFTFGGITFEEYNGTVTDSTGGSQSLIDAGEGRAFPLGTVDTFRTFAGPADFNESVNRLGRLYYSKIEESKFGRGWDIHTQSNPLPMCMRPAVLVRVHTSN